jgi:hypothetical protein
MLCVVGVQEQMMPQEAMFMLLNKETAAGRVPGGWGFPCVVGV